MMDNNLEGSVVTELDKPDADFKWNYLDLYKNAFKTLFMKGFKAWFIVAFITLLFYLGTKGSYERLLISTIDDRLGRPITASYEGYKVLQKYAESTSFGQFLDLNNNDVAKAVVFSLLEKNQLLIHLLAMNMEYFERNTGEVFGFLIIAVILMYVGNFIFCRISEIGLCRFYMENRYQKNVKVRRIFAPYGDKKLWHVVGVYIKYLIVIELWSLTIIGGIYKVFQYSMVPYLLAENPSLTWKQARDLSKHMTHGYKWKIFVATLPSILVSLVSFIPFIRILTLQAWCTQVNAEIYFTLRKRTDIDRSAFIEKAFDGPLFVDTDEYLEAKTREEKKELDSKVPEYKLKDVLLGISNFDESDKYVASDFIIMFFVFCLVGWLWEVGLHIIRDHAFVNRGMMYGPWIPIYGFGGVFIIFFLNRFKNNKVKLVVFTMVLCGILEYLTSLVLDYAMNASYWNYKAMKFNLNGRICLAGLTAFAIGGFAGVYLIGPAIKGALRKFGKKRTLVLCIILVTAFIIDGVCCKIFGPNTGKGVGGSIESKIESGYVVTYAEEEKGLSKMNLITSSF